MKPALYAYLIAANLLCGAVSGSAAMEEPLRDPARLVRPLDTVVQKVSTARVLVADYDLLRKDFPQLAALSEEAIDRWLLDQAGYLSEGQVKWANPRLSDPVPVEGPPGKLPGRKVHRPEGYGRALVFEVEGGLLDVKGAGSVSPKPGHHATGLLSTGEALREFIYEKKVQEIFAHSGLAQETVGSYAVIDWGFDLIEKDGKTRRPAGAVLRQAHERKSAQELKRANIFIDDKRAAELERVLRTYGVISSGEKWGPGVGAINIQGTRQGAVFDFGAFFVPRSYYGSVYRYEDADLVTARGAGAAKVKPLISANDPAYPKPDPELRLPVEFWGGSYPEPNNPKYDNLNKRGNELVREWREGKATLGEVRGFVKDYLESKKFPVARAGWFAAQAKAVPCSKLYRSL